MRMWMIPPERLCRQHLLGEHKETHMLAGCVARGRSLRGYVATGLVELQSVPARHEALAAEMARRGYRHASPLPGVAWYAAGAVDPARSIRDLAARCQWCAVDRC